MTLQTQLFNKYSNQNQINHLNIVLNST